MRRSRACGMLPLLCAVACSISSAEHAARAQRPRPSVTLVVFKLPPSTCYAGSEAHMAALVRELSETQLLQALYAKFGVEQVVSAMGAALETGLQVWVPMVRACQQQQQQQQQQQGTHEMFPGYMPGATEVLHVPKHGHWARFHALPCLLPMRMCRRAMAPAQPTQHPRPPPTHPARRLTSARQVTQQQQRLRARAA